MVSLKVKYHDVNHEQMVKCACVGLQCRAGIREANLMSLCHVMPEMPGKHVEHRPMPPHHQSWRSCRFVSTSMFNLR